MSEKPIRKYSLGICLLIKIFIESDIKSGKKSSKIWTIFLNYMRYDSVCHNTALSTKTDLKALASNPVLLLRKTQVAALYQFLNKENTINCSFNVPKLESSVFE